MTAEIDWTRWLARWDAQQTAYLPDREARFTAMFDVLDVLMPAEFVALDLACGPGSISQRLLARFPLARAVALDFDPALLALGQGALGTMDGRLRWVDADLRGETWVAHVGEKQVDAVLSTTALHWFPADEIVTIYRKLGELIRPGGVLLNGDHLQFAPHLETFRRVSEMVSGKFPAHLARPGVEDWRGWWDALATESVMAEFLAERERRYATRRKGWTEPIFDLHEAALRDAGFREVGVIWQTMHNRVLLAVR